MLIPRFITRMFRKRGATTPDPSALGWLSERARLATAGLADPMLHTWTYVAVDRITTHMASVPLRLYSLRGKDRTELETGPWVEFFQDPNPDMTPGDFWEITRQHLLLPGGESFWVLTDGRGKVCSRGEIPRYALPVSGRTFTHVENSTGVLTGWEQQVGHRTIKRAPWELVHFRLPHPNRPHRGMAPYEAVQRAVRTDAKAHIRNEALLDNDSTPAGILSSDEVLSVDQAKILRQEWKDKYGGADNAGKTAVLGQGAKYQQVGLSPKDMEHQKQLEWARQEVAAGYGVPLFLMTILGDVHRETSREAMKLFWTGSIIPKLVREQNTLRRDLFLRHGGEELVAVWDLSGVEALRREMKERAETGAILWKSGISMEEVNRRFELGLEEQPGWDIPFVPIGVQPAALATEDDEPPPRAAARASHWSEGQRKKLRGSYIKSVQGPGEKKLKAALRTSFREIRRTVLKWLAKQRAVRELTEDEIVSFLDEQQEKWRKDIEKRTKPALTWITEASLGRLEDQLGTELQVVSMSHPRVLEFIAEHGGRNAKNLSQVLKEGLRDQLLEGKAEGENLTQLQARVRQVMNIASSRAHAIARTESGSASSGAKYEAYQLEGVQKHSWLTAQDDHVTDGEDDNRDHQSLDGEVVPVGTPFSNGLLYPGDPAGTAREVVNCRCETLPEVD